MKFFHVDSLDSSIQTTTYTGGSGETLNEENHESFSFYKEMNPPLYSQMNHFPKLFMYSHGF